MNQKFRRCGVFVLLDQYYTEVRKIDQALAASNAAMATSSI